MYPFFDPMLFKERLVETILWCTRQLEESADADQLRQLLPEPDDMDELHKEDPLRTFAEQIFAERRQRVQPHDVYLTETDKISLEDGIMVVFHADEAAAWDGVAQLYSKGYFDFNGFPAWDSWVYCVSRSHMKAHGLDRHSTHLLSWVPPQFVSDVKYAIPFIMDSST